MQKEVPFRGFRGSSNLLFPVHAHLNAQRFQRFIGSILLRTLLVEIFPNSDFFSIYKHSNLETIAVIEFKSLHHAVINFASILLAEFEELAFIVIIVFFQLVYIEMAA